MFQFRCGFCFETKTSQVRFARPLTKANDLKRDCSIQTLLSRAKHHTLAAAADFFQQFVIAEFAEDLCDALALRSTFWFIELVGAIRLRRGFGVAKQSLYLLFRPRTELRKARRKNCENVRLAIARKICWPRRG